MLEPVPEEPVNWATLVDSVEHDEIDSGPCTTSPSSSTCQQRSGPSQLPKFQLAALVFFTLALRHGVHVEQPAEDSAGIELTEENTEALSAQLRQLYVLHRCVCKKSSLLGMLSCMWFVVYSVCAAWDVVLHVVRGLCSLGFAFTTSTLDVL